MVERGVASGVPSAGASSSSDVNRSRQYHSLQHSDSRTVHQSSAVLC